jgi:hypothetical protein
MRIRRASVVAPILLIAAGLGCTGDEDVDDRRVVQTGVVVDPAEFLGDLPCADIEGAPKSYVATVVELADETGPERLLGPAAPVSCGTPVVFNDIRGGRRYGAQISVFDVASDQAAGATAAWTTTCGLTGAGAADIVAGRQTRIRGCTAIEGAGTGTTSITVDASSAVGALGCTADGGTIGDIQIVPVEPAASGLPVVTVACGQEPVVYGAAIEAGVRYAFRLEAESSDGGTLGAQCSAVARDGLGVPATCTLLLETGSLSFPIPDLVEEAGFVCGESISRATVSAVGGEVTVPSASVPCNAAAFASSLPPGAYSGTIALYAGPDLAASFTCAGEVVPGVTTVLTCIPI